MANKKARKAKKKDPLDEIFEMHFKRDDEIKKNYLKVRGLPMMDSEVFLTQAAEILGYSRQLLQKAMRKKGSRFSLYHTRLIHHLLPNLPPVFL